MTPTLGKKIQYLRRIKGLKQGEVAEKLTMSQQAYSRLENDQTKPTHEQLKKVADALGVSLEDLEKWDGKFVFNQFGSTSQNGQINHFKALAEEERGLYQQLLDQKDTEIVHLKEEITRLHSLLDRVLKQ